MKQEIWTMTRKEYFDSVVYPKALKASGLYAKHNRAVKRIKHKWLMKHSIAVIGAIRDGLAVPKKVLNDYPYLIEILEDQASKPQVFIL